MIKLIIGGVGSGKTCSMVKDIIDRKEKTYVNFPVKTKNIVRLRKDHIMNIERNEKGKIIKHSINWDYWKSVMLDGGFDMVFDESQNIFHSRRAMSNWNVNFSKFLSQIRKILGESEHNHIYFLTQRFGGIDISLRELAHQIIICKKHQLGLTMPTKVRNTQWQLKTVNLPITYIIKYTFVGENCLDKLQQYYMGGSGYDYISYFIGNPYFQYYRSYDIVDLDDDDVV